MATILGLIIFYLGGMVIGWIVRGDWDRKQSAKAVFPKRKRGPGRPKGTKAAKDAPKLGIPQTIAAGEPSSLDGAE